jgi:Peptidase C10 family.
MSFGSDASGAQTVNTASALRNYFSFSQNIFYKTRSGTDKDWQDQLNDQLLHGRPIIYAGDAGDGQPGHAFNIDGVNDNGYISY